MQGVDDVTRVRASCNLEQHMGAVSCVVDQVGAAAFWGSCFWTRGELLDKSSSVNKRSSWCCSLGAVLRTVRDVDALLVDTIGDVWLIAHPIVLRFYHFHCGRTYLVGLFMLRGAAVWHLRFLRTVGGLFGGVRVSCSHRRRIWVLMALVLMSFAPLVVLLPRAGDGREGLGEAGERPQDARAEYALHHEARDEARSAQPDA